MAPAEPNVVPAATVGSSFRNSHKSSALPGISNPQWGSLAPERNLIPGWFAKPCQVTVERDRPAVAHRRRSDTNDHAAQHCAAHRRLPILRLDVELHGRSRQQPTIGFHQSTARREINQLNLMARSDPGDGDAMLARVAASCFTSFGMAAAHDDFHWLAIGSNLSTRTFPVAPKIRTTYWAWRPRM